MQKKSGLKELFSLLRKLNNSLLDLRLVPLPQLSLIMLLERSIELRAAMQQSAHKVYKRKLQAEERGWDGPLDEFKQTLAAAHVLFRQLRTVRQGVNEDLSLAEQCIKYNDFPKMIQVLSQQLRAIGADTEKQMEALSPAQIFKKKTDEIKNITRSIGQLAKTNAELNQWGDKKIADHCKEFEAIFTQLETNPALTDINKNVVFELRGTAYNNIASSGLFDEPFYLSQLPDKGKGVRDALKNYLMESHDISPCRFFNDEYYREEYPFVQALRYSPLEHFARYGEPMRLNPGPELDILFYLKSNEDILNAGVSPYRHFIHHGMDEGRPPSSRAGNFLSKEYMVNTGVRLAFIGTPENEERLAWEVLQTRCSEKPNGQEISISVEELDSQEYDFDGIVVGATALANLDKNRLSALAKSEAALVYIGNNPQEDLQNLLDQNIFPLTRVCAITYHYERFLRWQEGIAPIRLLYYPFKDAEESLPLAEAVLSKLAYGEEFTLRRFPQPAEGTIAASKPIISVVSIIYKKLDEMLAFLEAINRQDIAHPYEVILVDDASPDDTVEQVTAWLDEKRTSGLLNCHMDVRILSNETNSGNCISRNRGIEAAQADIILVADGDMAFGTSNLSEHVWAYRFGDCDATIGFFRFDLNRELVFDWLAACEIDSAIISRKLLNQKDPLTSHGKFQFLGHGSFNFITKNVSFKKSFFKGKYFDPEFTYSAKPDSGYGVEDQEFGAQIYFAGGKIRFIERAFAIHIKHANNSYSENRALAVLRNWEKLLVKHPDLALVDRQYYQHKTQDLLHRTASRQDAPEHVASRNRYAAPQRAHVSFRATRPLRVLTYRWHTPHQYELFKLGQLSVTLATNLGTRHCDLWDYAQRPLPRNVQMAPLETINPNDFDLAILPFDEHILYPEYRNAPADWGNAFLSMLEATKDIPRVALCHGTPQRYEDNIASSGNTPGALIPGSKEALRDLLGDIHVVCNSHQAQREWEFAKSSVIWHGFWPLEFPEGNHRRGCLTMSQKAYEGRPIYRGEEVRQRVKELLGEKYILEYTNSPAPHPGYTMRSQEWAIAKFQNYVEYIGDFSIYFNPTINSPMPRSRGEAMMTGTIPVSLRSHDVDMFIENGVNGFYGDSPEELAEQIKWLLSHDKERREMSRKARLTAMDIFNIDRYLSSWNELIAREI